MDDVSRGRRRTRSHRRDGAHPPKVRSTFTLTGEAVERIEVHARRLGIRPSELVERLVNEHCRRFVVQDRGQGQGQGQGAGGDARPEGEGKGQGAV